MMQLAILTFCQAARILHNRVQVLNTPSNQRSNRHDSAVLSCPNWAISPSATGGNGYGWDGANGNAARMSDCMCSTSRPPYALEQAEGGFQPNQGFDMPSIQTAATATSTPTTDTASTNNLQAILAAYNAAGLAQSYLERGNFAAARRKLVLALRDIETALKKGGAA